MRDDNLARWLLGEQDAINALLLIFNIGEVWDDITDQDKPISRADINGAFLQALCYLPLNPFFDRHKREIIPVMMLGINAWMDSCELEQAPHSKDRLLAWFLRDVYMELFSLFALKVGGFQHLRAVSAEARQFFNHEAYKDWEHATSLAESNEVIS